MLFKNIAVIVITIPQLWLWSFTSFCHPSYFVSYIEIVQEYTEPQTKKDLRILRLEKNLLKGILIKKCVSNLSNVWYNICIYHLVWNILIFSLHYFQRDFYAWYTWRDWNIYFLISFETSSSLSLPRKFEREN